MARRQLQDERNNKMTKKITELKQTQTSEEILDDLMELSARVIQRTKETEEFNKYLQSLIDDHANK